MAEFAVYQLIPKRVLTDNGKPFIFLPDETISVLVGFAPRGGYAADDIQVCDVVLEYVGGGIINVSVRDKNGYVISSGEVKK